jgi:pimeloyl-ACP methyl ester carboxylesterase
VETFCLVHGAWHDDACWELLVAELARRPHECLTPVLPLEDPTAPFADYAAVVLNCLGGRENTVLVGHSMASAVIPLVAARVRLKLLVYLCPAMGGLPPRADEPQYQRATGIRPPIDPENCSWWPPERAITQLYSRLDPQLAERLAPALRPQPQALFSAPYPLKRPPAVPSAFLYARGDELFGDSWSRWIAAKLLDVQAIELRDGQFPMLEHPAILAKMLEQLSDTHGGGTDGLIAGSAR